MALMRVGCRVSAYAHDLGIVGSQIKSGGDLEARAEPGPRAVRITGNQEQPGDPRRQLVAVGVVTQCNDQGVGSGALGGGEQSDRVEAVRCGQLVDLSSKRRGAVDVAAREQNPELDRICLRDVHQSPVWTDVLDTTLNACLRGLGADEVADEDTFECLQRGEIDEPVEPDEFDCDSVLLAVAGEYCLPCDLVPMRSFPITAAERHPR